MADERTASTITWLNSALCSSQKSATLINQVQIVATKPGQQQQEDTSVSLVASS